MAGQSLRIVPKGLVTDPSRLVAGDGGLTQARNVIFRSEGLVEPRAALSLYANEDAIDTEFTRSMHAREWAGETIAALHNGDEYAYYRDGVNLLTCEALGDITKFRMYSELADGRMMFSTPNGLRMLDQPDQGTSESIGHGAFIRMPGAPRVTVNRIIYVAFTAPYTTGFLAQNETTAYRVTVVRWIEDSGGRRIPIEGPPSDRFVVENFGATDANVAIEINVEGDVRPGDEVRLYRTVANGTGSGDPGDLMVLRYAWTKDDSALAASYDFEIYDQLPGSEMSGPALYTNQGVEDASRANYRLRTARDLALYQNKLFYAGGDAGWRQSSVIRSIGVTDSYDKSGTLVSVYTTTNQAWTTASPVISGLPGTIWPYLSVGQIVTGWDGSNLEPPTDPNAFGLYGKIVSWDDIAGTITIDRDATATETTRRVIVWDWFAWEDSGGNWYPIFAPVTSIALPGQLESFMSLNGSSSGLVSYGVIPVNGASSNNAPAHGGIEWAWDNTYHQTSVSTYRALPRMYSQTGPDPSGNITVTIEYDASFGNIASQETPDQLDFSSLDRIALTSSKPGAFGGAVGRTYDESKAANRDSVATLWMSKTNQPESVPLPNFVVVGDASLPITRIFATTDRLWVLKPDGLYSVTCPTDDIRDLVLTLVDGTFRMIDLAPDGSGINCGTWASKVRDTVFAWTRNGIMAIGSGGVVRVDSAIETDIRSKTPSYDEDETENIVGTPFCAASERESMIVFGASGAFGEGVTTGWCYVLHVESGAWSTFDGLPASSSSNPSIFPSFSEGYGASTTGLWRIPSYAGFLSYLDVPSRNNASQSSDRPVTGDRTNVQLAPTILIQSVTGRTATIDSYPYDITGWYIYDSDGAWYLVLSWASGDPLDTITLDREGAFTGDVTDIHYAAPRTVTYSANQPPNTEKHFGRVYTHWQQLRGGTQYEVSFRARGQVASSSVETVNYDGPDSQSAATYPGLRLANNLEYDRSAMVPRDVGRARGVEITVSQNQADVYFASDGLTIGWGDESPKIPGRS